MEQLFQTMLVITIRKKILHEHKKKKGKKILKIEFLPLPKSFQNYKLI